MNVGNVWNGAIRWRTAVQDELDFRGLKMLKEKMQGKRVIHSGVSPLHNDMIDVWVGCNLYLNIYIYINMCRYISNMYDIHIIYECLFAT